MPAASPSPLHTDRLEGLPEKKAAIKHVRELSSDTELPTSCHRHHRPTQRRRLNASVPLSRTSKPPTTPKRRDYSTIIMYLSKCTSLPQYITTLAQHIKLWSFVRITHSIERKHLRLVKMMERNNLAIAQRRASVAETEAILEKQNYPSGIFDMDIQQVYAALEGLKEELWYMTWVSKSMEKDIVEVEAELKRRNEYATTLMVKVNMIPIERSRRVEIGYAPWWMDQRLHGV